mgnify:CR=1 FL=1
MLVGIECGGTHTTVATTASAATPTPTHFQLGPANFRLTTPDGFAALFTEAFSRIEEAPAAIGLAVAGARHPEQHQALEAMLRAALGGMGGWQEALSATVPVRASHDLDSALLATGPLDASTPRLVCIAGTGSACYGRRGSSGKEVRGGGWGHLLGDEGSVFMLGSGLLRLLTVRADRARRSGADACPLAKRVLKAAGLGDDPAGWDGMIGW